MSDAHEMAMFQESDAEAFVASNDLLGTATELRARLRQDGYLFLRETVNPASLSALREDILRVCQRHGWLDPQCDLMDGVASGPPRREGQEAYFVTNDDIQKLERFHALAHHPALLRIMTGILGGSVLVHPLSVSRIMFPQDTVHTTPAHQDYPNNQGAEETYAVWVPLGACPRELGGLAVLRGSHRLGVLPMRPSPGAGYRTVIPNDAMRSLRWVSGDFSPGDVLIFHSLTIHRALPNRTPNRLRLSVDYRYQDATQPVSDKSLLPHYIRVPWDVIYRGWSSTQHQYYWRKLNLDVVAYDPRREFGAATTSVLGGRRTLVRHAVRRLRSLCRITARGR